MRRVAKSDHEVHFRSVRAGKFADGFATKVFDVVSQMSQAADNLRQRFFSWVRASRVGVEFSATESLKKGFRHDGSSGIVGTQEENVESGHDLLPPGNVVRLWLIWRLAAEFGSALATIARQKIDEPPEARDIGAIVHHAPVFRRLYQPCTGQDAEVCGHRVVRDIAASGDLARGEAFRMNGKQHPKNLKTGRLRQGSESLQSHRA